MYPSYQERTTYRARQSKPGLVAKLHDALRLLASMANDSLPIGCDWLASRRYCDPSHACFRRAASLLTKRGAPVGGELRQAAEVADRLARSILLLQRTPADFTTKSLCGELPVSYDAGQHRPSSV